MKKTGYIFLLLPFWALFCSPGAYSQSETASESVHRFTVVSEYIQDGNAASSLPRTWTILVFKDEAGQGITAVYSEGSDQELCRIIRASDPDAPMKAKYPGVARKPDADFKDLLIDPGFPAPCDVLPLDQKMDVHTYRVERSAGGRSFVTQYSVSRKPVSLKKATQKGWIKPQAAPPPEPLTEWTVVDAQGNIVERQIWSPNEKIWLYEETPYRRSWRLH